jgi:hypothetical protein
MFVIGSIFFIGLAVIVMPFGHVAFATVLSAVLYFALHVHPVAVFGFYFLAYVGLWLLSLLGLLGTLTWLVRKK